MKHIPSFKKLAAGGGLTLMCALSVAADTPNYLIEIDVSDLTKVTFTATTNSASVADSSGDAFDGIDLLDFLIPRLTMTTIFPATWPLATRARYIMTRFNMARP